MGQKQERQPPQRLAFGAAGAPQKADPACEVVGCPAGHTLLCKGGYALRRNSEARTRPRNWSGSEARGGSTVAGAVPLHPLS
jgi:hypothetical protein